MSISAGLYAILSDSEFQQLNDNYALEFTTDFTQYSWRIFHLLDHSILTDWQISPTFPQALIDAEKMLINLYKNND
jgi:hypothetical protein